MLIVLGINHKTAPLELRERVAFDPQTMTRALGTVRDAGNHQGVAILSTCNRTELYLEMAGPDTSAGEDREIFAMVSPVLDWLADWHRLDRSVLEPACYIYANKRAVTHLIQVASGLDSLVLGEPQILGQMKSAYSTALDADTLSSGLHRSFQKAFATAKRIRTETAIGRNPVSVASAAVRLSRQVFTDLKSKTALLIGAGETIHLVSQHLMQQGVHDLVIANRTLNNAQKLANRMGGNVRTRAILLADIPEYLHEADILISSTASQLPILGKGVVESALKRRKRRLMFMVDIAVPRDIEHEVGDIDEVYLFSVDDLSDAVEESRRSREEAALDARSIVEESAEQWLRDQRSADSVDLIKVFRGQSLATRDAELRRALAALEAGEPAETVLERLANNLTNKLIHRPTAELNRAIGEDRKDLLDAARLLLGLDGAG